MGICRYAVDASKRNKSNTFLSKQLRFPIVAGQKKRKRDFGTRYFKELQDQLFDSMYLEIVATFEGIVSARIGTAVGTARTLIKQHYPDDKPFHKSISGFVKQPNQLDNLSGVRNLLERKLPPELGDRLKQIVEYRDHIAHGRRFGKTTDLSIEEVAATLEDVLNRI